jgi:hypothetical protein
MPPKAVPGCDDCAGRLPYDRRIHKLFFGMANSNPLRSPRRIAQPWSKKKMTGGIRARSSGAAGQ